MSDGPFHLHIEELVLHGFPATERRRIADALQRELALALAVQRSVVSPPASIAVERIDAGAFSAHGRNPSQIGGHLARSVSGAVAGAINAPAKSKGAAPW